MKMKKRYKKTVREMIDKINEYRDRGMVMHEAAFEEALEIVMKNFEDDKYSGEDFYYK